VIQVTVDISVCYGASYNNRWVSSALCMLVTVTLGARDSSVACQAAFFSDANLKSSSINSLSYTEQVYCSS